MSNEKEIKLLQQEVVVMRLVERYRYLQIKKNSTSDKDVVNYCIDRSNMVTCCFGDCFDLTFEKAEQFLKNKVG